MNYSTFPFPVRCRLCNFSSAHPYAIMNHDCGDYMNDSCKCIAFPYCSHTADECADNEYSPRVVVSYSGYSLTVMSAWDSERETILYSVYVDAPRYAPVSVIDGSVIGYDNAGDAIRKAMVIVDSVVRFGERF